MVPSLDFSERKRYSRRMKGLRKCYDRSLKLAGDSKPAIPSMAYASKELQAIDQAYNTLIRAVRMIDQVRGGQWPREDDTYKGFVAALSTVCQGLEFSTSESHLDRKVLNCIRILVDEAGMSELRESLDHAGETLALVSGAYYMLSEVLGEMRATSSWPPTSKLREYKRLLQEAAYKLL